jgi:Icc-related predicted phosphoesterase
MTKKIIIAVVIAVVFIVGGNFLLGKLGVGEVEIINETEAPKVENKINDELQRIIDEENFRKETILRARKVANDRKKEEEIARNKQAMAVIEAEYEAIRQAEIVLVGGSTSTTSSLK